MPLWFFSNTVHRHSRSLNTADMWQQGTVLFSVAPSPLLALSIACKKGIPFTQKSLLHKSHFYTVTKSAVQFFFPLHVFDICKKYCCTWFGYTAHHSSRAENLEEMAEAQDIWTELLLLGRYMGFQSEWSWLAKKEEKKKIKYFCLKQLMVGSFIVLQSGSSENEQQMFQQCSSSLSNV